jgi:hypothetical protein
LSTSALSDAELCGGGFMGFPTLEEYRPTTTLADMLKESTDIFAGEIVATGEGAFNGTPGSLLRLRIVRQLRDSGDVTHTDGTVLLAYPYATLRIHEQTYCTRPSSLEGLLPHLMAGDRVVLFNYSPGLGSDHSVIQVDVARRLIIEHRGELTIPVGIRPEVHGRNFDDLLEEVAGRLRQEPDAGRGALHNGHAN